MYALSRKDDCIEEKLMEIRERAEKELSELRDATELENFRVQVLGKKGELTGILKQMGSLSAEERPKMGQLANEVRASIEAMLKEKTAELRSKEQEAKLKKETIDVTLPGKKHEIGHKHPLSIVLDEVKDIFVGMGFQIATGPEVEWDYYNFEALNLPPDHPARDTQDTFYITEKMLLRTQTSPVQIRVMEKQEPPIRIIAPGRVYRLMRLTQHIRRSSIKSRDWLWIKELQWAISKVVLCSLQRDSTARIPR